MTYVNVVSVPIEKHKYIWHTSPVTPQVASTRLTLCGQRCIRYENIFTCYRRRPHDTLMSSCSRCAVVASHMIDTRPLPHDRDCPQASLVLRGRVQYSHHLTGGNLASYLFIGTPLQNSKLHKVNVESKSQLACHLLRLI
jgi:hypothetical protein